MEPVACQGIASPVSNHLRLLSLLLTPTPLTPYQFRQQRY
jgi:hypothetical protein